MVKRRDCTQVHTVNTSRYNVNTAIMNLSQSYLVNSGLKRVCADVDNVDSVASQAWKNKLVTSLSFVPKTAGACVPAAMVKLVTHIRHIQDMDH